MKSTRLGALGALCALIAIGATAGVAPAASSPAATAAKAFVSGTPSSIACGGFVDQRVTVTGQAGSSGAAHQRDARARPLGQHRHAGEQARRPPARRDRHARRARRRRRRDRPVDRRQRRGRRLLPRLDRHRLLPLGSSYSALVAAINALPAPSGGSPHAAGINAAAAALAAAGSGYARALVLVTDGQAAGAELTDANAAATAAKAGGVRIVPVGVGTGADVSPTNLQSLGLLARLLPVRHARPDQPDAAGRRPRRRRGDPGRASP